MENPQYKTKGTDNEEDVTLGVGLTVRFVSRCLTPGRLKLNAAVAKTPR